jgi:excisionase family DNA binding protein
MERRAVSSPPPTPEILTVPEVAKYLRVTSKTVYALVRRGELVGFRVGRVLRLRKADVDGFVQRAAKEIEA